MPTRFMAPPVRASRRSSRRARSSPPRPRRSPPRRAAATPPSRPAVPCSQRPSASRPRSRRRATASRLPYAAPSAPGAGSARNSSQPAETPAPAASDARRPPPAIRTSSARLPPAASALTWPCAAATDGPKRSAPAISSAIRGDSCRRPTPSAPYSVVPPKKCSTAARAPRPPPSARGAVTCATLPTTCGLASGLARAGGVQRDLRPARPQELVGLDGDRRHAAVFRDARQVDVAPDALVRHRVAHLDIDGRLRRVAGGELHRQRRERRGRRVRVTRARGDPLRPSVCCRSDSTLARCASLHPSAPSCSSTHGPSPPAQRGCAAAGDDSMKLAAHTASSVGPRIRPP